MSERRAAKVRSGELRLAHNSTLSAPTSRIRRTKALRPKPRSPEEFARIYHSPEFIFFVHHLLLCCVCGAEDPDWAHLTNGGMGRKADVQDGAPLCDICHTMGPDSYHAGRDSFLTRNAHIDFALTGPRALDAFEEPDVQAWLTLMKEDGTFDRWLERGRAA